jgi:hypothetical protein
VSGSYSYSLSLIMTPCYWWAGFLKYLHPNTQQLGAITKEVNQDYFLLIAITE